jgi:hypothetical protein
MNHLLKSAVAAPRLSAGPPRGIILMTGQVSRNVSRCKPLISPEKHRDSYPLAAGSASRYTHLRTHDE